MATTIDNSGEPKPLINEKSTILGILIPFMVVQWICVSLRFWSRSKLRCLGYDDAFVLIAAIFATLGSIFICRSTENGLGEHFSQIGDENIVGFQRKYYISLVTYNVATTFTKLCLLAQYIRMFDSRGPLRRTCWAFLVVTVLWGAAFIVIAVVPCVPVSAFWDRGTGRCYGYGSIDSPALQRTYTAHNTTNVLLDLVVLAIPVPLYFEKSTPWKTRIGIGCLLMLGVGVNLVSIWRLQTIIQTKATTYPVADPTWYGPKSIVLATIEVNLASICASIPVFWPILSQSLNKIFVTQEVHVVHQHRRLSGGEHDHRQCGYLDEGEGCAAEDHYELRASESGTTSHSRAGSESSLNLFRAKSGASVLTKLQREKERDRNHHNHYPAPPMPTLHHNHHHHNQHYSDKYVASRVAPLGDCNSNISASNEIKSDGQKGFKKEQERFGSRNGSGGGGGGGLGGGGGGGGAGFQQQPKSMFED